MSPRPKPVRGNGKLGPFDAGYPTTTRQPKGFWLTKPCPSCRAEVGEPCQPKTTHTSRKRMVIRG